MKRIILILFAIGITAMSSVSMAAMSNSRVRKETRFLTDKMAYELNLNTAQYNDVYEINFDFIYSIRYLMDDVIRGYEWALDDYYNYLDVRNDDLRWVLSDAQYRRFLQADYFYRPIYASGGGWNFRVYITYTNRNYFYFPKPYHYRSYSGGHYRTHFHNVSYYRGRYNHSYYRGDYSVRNDRVYHTNRRSDFGSVNIRPNTSTRPSSRPGTTTTRPSVSTRPSTGTTRPSTGASTRPSTTTTRPSNTSSSSSSRENSSSSRRENNSSGSSTPVNNNTNSGSSRRSSSSSTSRTTTSPSSSSSNSNRSTTRSSSVSNGQSSRGSSASSSSSGSSSRRSSSSNSSERGSSSSRR
ncbi:hypothetical protein NXV73_06060 [Bacteroides salyersiae]|uniref:hypothetical protein n=1 Tax=Bacteroides salyersiae TaxID=291644 RepID=UPI00125CE108|nr:hypothetical protein [Bacteroides salyersiae]KAB5349865.1 hypothetical protein GAA62_03705 [Bacteroides salyersiae]KAB5355830.1 hypothetical protein GAA37_01245 [Bacteroides salyersiae]KAB5364437.1 hypothetical protein F9967_02395 [Bacteroides salyersiae]KAB5370625.1 hypothetical protein GAA00_02910 [Bacteroides salyersiae]KAB5378220.1 hypothetical protein F9993_03205 [Bacteroides salyersiae]